jgi:hypothetical protein
MIKNKKLIDQKIELNKKKGSEVKTRKMNMT